MRGESGETHDAIIVARVVAILCVGGVIVALLTAQRAVAPRIKMPSTHLARDKHDAERSKSPCSCWHVREVYQQVASPH